MVVSLAERTVSFGGYVAQIESADAAGIAFSGSASLSSPNLLAWGDIDGVTGVMSAVEACSYVSSDLGPSPGSSSGRARRRTVGPKFSEKSAARCDPLWQLRTLIRS